MAKISLSLDNRNTKLKMANHRLSVLSLNVQSGFTLLEVILSLAVLASLVVAVASLLQNTTAVKEGISETGNVNHRLQFALGKISRDLAHAFMIRKTDFDRRTKAVFRIEREDSNDKLSLTTFTHRPKRKDSKESDMTYVVYEIRKGEEASAPTHLYRGEAVRIPESFTDELEMVVLARAVKSLQLIPWDGSQWSQDKWNSTRSMYRSRIPHMIRVELEAYTNEELTDDTSWEEAETLGVKTVIFNHFATNFAQLKTVGAPVQWF